MSISVGFLIKHVRPIGDGFETYCTPMLISYLNERLDFSMGDIVTIFSLWRKTSEAAPHGASDLFVAAAQEVAFARWDELYPTSSSTLMFLNSDQLVSLSLAGQAAGADKQFNWRYGSDLPICVDINHDSGAHHIRWNAAGCRVATDTNRNIIHFYNLI
ncbi:MAG: hypothetical protein ACK4S7_07310 [Sphingorhabdus sp.]